MEPTPELPLIDSTAVALGPLVVEPEALRFGRITGEWSIGLIGSLVSIVFNYGATVVAVQFLTPTQYGLYALALSLVDLALIPVLFGMPGVISRYVPYYNARGEPGRSRSLIRLIMTITAAAGVAIAAALALGAGFVGATIFRKPELTPILRLMVIALPLLAFSETASYTFIALKELRYQVYTRKLFQPLLRLCLGASLLYMGYGVIGWTWTYLASLALGAVLAAWFFGTRVRPFFQRVAPQSIDYREIGSYALSLGLYSTLLIVLGQLEVVILGRTRSAAEIATFNVYILICTLLTVTETSVNQLYKAFASELIAQQAFAELRNLYRRIAQWVFAANLLVFEIILLFGVDIVVLFTNKSYLLAPVALYLLATGWLIASAIGPWDLTLQALAKTKLWAVNGLLMLAVRLALGVILIPKLGLIGASIAAACAVGIGAAAAQIEIFYLHRIHPFGKMQLKCLAVGAASAVVVLLAIRQFPVSGRLSLVWWIGVLTLIYGAGVLLSHSLTRADYLLLRSRLNRSGRAK